jgi:hypothetical protein
MIDPQLSDEAPAVTQRTLRQFAGLTLVVFGGLAAWQGLVQHRFWLALVLAGTAALVGSIGLARPEAIRPLYATLLALTHPIGRVVSMILMAGMFYLIFTPLGLLFRLVGRDALHTRLPARPSHWIQKPAVTDVRSYFRQS